MNKKRDQNIGNMTITWISIKIIAYKRISTNPLLSMYYIHNIWSQQNLKKKKRNLTNRALTVTNDF